MLKKSSQRAQWITGCFLGLLMVATRSHHFATPAYLPDASWAVFFLAGLYLRSALWWGAFAVLAGVVDWVAITFGGVPGFCVTPAYMALFLAYGALWEGGRWYARHHRDGLMTLVPLMIAVALSALGAELCSSGSFYFLGGRFAHPSLADFLAREGHYFPLALGGMAFYVALAAIAHVVFVLAIPGQGAVRQVRS